MKLPKQLRKRYHTDYYDRTAFASKARLLQSIWRTEKGYELEEKVKGKNIYGNFLQLDFAKESGANFLTPEYGATFYRVNHWLLIYLVS